MLSRVVIKKQKGRRFLTALAVIGLISGTLFVASTALAVHDLKLQLDGDVSLQCFPAGAPGDPNTTPPTPPCTTQTVDWGGNLDNTTIVDSGNGLFKVSHPTTTTELVCPNPALVVVASPPPAGCTAGNGAPFTAASFTRDFESGAGCTLNSTSTTFCTSDDTTYATGSKDTLGIGNGGWQCNHDANVNSKIDIMNSYVASYKNAAGDLILYFGLEKNKSNGTNDVGVWFLRGDASCTAPKGHINFTGQHRDGDTLIVSEFTAGGGVSTIKAFRWAANASFPGDSGCIDSHDNPDPSLTVNGFKGCDLKPVGSGQDCKTSGTGTTDLLCATTNASGSAAFNSTVKTPWLTSDATLGVGNSVPTPDFIEGGINITQTFRTAGGGAAPSCFSVGIPDTRSSASVTATLFDFVINKLGGCTETLTTSAAGTASGSIGTGSVSSGTDTATLTITGTPTWGGDLTWYLCGPVSTDACLKTQGVLVTTTTVSESSLPADFVSGTATLTKVGRYCWTAHFEPNQATKDAGVTAIDDTQVGECFDVAPVTPTLTTSASCSADPDPCVLGSTLSDKAFLSGTASQPGTLGPSTTYPSINPTVAGNPADHNISWVLYSPASGGCSVTKATSPTTAAVSGDRPGPATFYGPTSYTTLVTDGVGTYTFVASYPGDGAGSNTNAATSTSCPDTSGTETVTVIGTASSSSKQGWLPNDRITLNSTAGTTLKGTLTATLYYGAMATGSTLSNCTLAIGAENEYSKTFTIDQTGKTPTNSVTVFTDNSTFYVGTRPDTGAAGGSDTDATHSYLWLIHYADNSLTSPTDSCETTTITHNDGS